MMDIKDVERLVHLSRLALTADEKESLRKDMDSILGYVEQINKVSASLNAENNSGLVCNVFREDTNPHESGMYTETLLSAAPSREKNYVKVKKIL